MVRTKGDRLKQSETKTNIIRYILEKQGPVGEPDIRKYLEEKFEIKDQGSINRHLHDLRRGDYIEMLPTKPGLRNEWDIINIKQLKNIKEKFNEIELNEFEKSLKIILQENEIEPGAAEDPETAEYNEIKEILRHSTTFFNMFLEYDKDELKTKTRAYFFEKIRKQQYPNLIKGTKGQLEAFLNDNWYYFLFEYCYETDVFNGSIETGYKNFTETKLHYWFSIPHNGLATYIAFHDDRDLQK